MYERPEKWSQSNGKGLRKATANTLYFIPRKRRSHRRVFSRGVLGFILKRITEFDREQVSGRVGGGGHEQKQRDQRGGYYRVQGRENQVMIERSRAELVRSNQISIIHCEYFK